MAFAVFIFCYIVGLAFILIRPAQQYATLLRLSFKCTSEVGYQSPGLKCAHQDVSLFCDVLQCHYALNSSVRSRKAPVVCDLRNGVSSLRLISCVQNTCYLFVFFHCFLCITRVRLTP